MKKIISLMSASAIVSTLVLAESITSTAVQSTHQMMEQERTKNEIQNRFRNMNTDELLEKRGTMTNQKEREQLHNELMNRQQKMTAKQKEKFSRSPEKISQEMGSQDKGMGYGQGQGAVQGQHKGMMKQNQEQEMMQNKRKKMGGGGKGGR